jgi:hypothetical protein
VDDRPDDVGSDGGPPFGVPPGGDSPAPRRRAIGILFLLMLLALPFAVAVQLQGFRERLLPPLADQPGGTLTGTVTLPDGTPAAALAVRLLAIPERDVLAETTTAADGTFELVAPPRPNSAYVVRTGGGAHRWIDEPISFVDRHGEAFDPDPLELALEPGATLVVRLTRPDGKLPGPGTITVRGGFGGGSLFSPFQRWIEHVQPFDEGAEIRVDGLPPLKGSVQVELDAGTGLTVEDVQLAVGETVLAYEL